MLQNMRKQNSILIGMCVLPVSIINIGCQNDLTVRVELLDVEGGIEFIDTQDEARELLAKSIDSLGRAESALITANGLLPNASEAVKADLRRVKQLRETGEELAEPGGGVVGGRGGDHLNAKEVALFANSVHAMRNSLFGTYSTFAQLLHSKSIQAGTEDAFQNALGEAKGYYDSAWSSARAAAQSASGFGGFASVGTHTISPSDPMYHKVLNARSKGRPFTTAHAGVSGDSTVIFVQESPTQVRVYSVDMDPTQLVQNIMLISDKALQAGIQLASPAN